MKTQYFYRIKNNRLGATFLQSDCVEDFIFNLDDPIERTNQSELNDFLKLHCQYELICKLLDYNRLWKVEDEDDLFVNKGVCHIINNLVTYLKVKIQFPFRKSYAALWCALIDLNLLRKTDAESFKNWVNSSFLKDAPNGSAKGGKIEGGKSIREAIDDLYKFQTKEGIEKLFKDLTEEEISQLKYGNKLKNLYRKSILILSKAFKIDLGNESFQPYITGYSDMEDFLSDFPEDKNISWIMECFCAYEDFSKHKFL